MNKSLVIKILLILFAIILLVFVYSNLNKKKEIELNQDIETNNFDTNSNVIKDVNYISRDASGNEYILFASEGRIDISDNKKIFH